MIEILTGDFRELSKQLADNSVDLVLTDPPYSKDCIPLWRDMAEITARVLKPGGFLVSYSGQMYLPQVLNLLGEHLEYYWFIPLVMKGPNCRVFLRKLGQQAKPVLIYSKGKAGTHEWWTDYIESPYRSKKYHKWGQSLVPFRQLAEWFSRPGDLILDPFLGGGTTALACLQTGRSCIGYEIDETMADVARQRLATAQLPLPISAPETVTQLGLITS